MTSHILPVSSLTGYIKQVLSADDILADMWIEGEISRLSQARSGHIYFTLTEGDSVIDCVMWRTSAARQAFVPRVGDAVIVHGHADFYPPQGRLQVIADVFEHQGQGILALEMERLRQKLEAEGLFDPARKRPLPAFPRRVGVVTSSSGAVWHDIQTVTARRFPLVELVLIPTAVQGTNAPAQICAAIKHMSAIGDIDVVIVGRGGGSAEDLACFNSEDVARAIFASSVPVVSAVGHESDVSIADFVADHRAPTPSAAAEMVLPDRAELLIRLADSRDDLVQIIEQRLADERNVLSHLQRRLHHQSPLTHVTRAQQQLDLLGRRLQAAAQSDMRHRNRNLAGMQKLLDALHPTAVLERGYARIERGTTPIRRASDLSGPTDVDIHFHDGSARGTIRPVSSNDEQDSE